jgi:hypothetical protein
MITMGGRTVHLAHRAFEAGSDDERLTAARPQRGGPEPMPPPAAR